MRPSRTQLVLVAIALVAACLQHAPRVLDVPVGLATVAYFEIVILVATAAALAYGYHIGRVGRAGSVRTVAREYLVAGLVGVAALFATGFFAFDYSLGDPWMFAFLVFRSTTDFLVPFVLAGLAGVPLGAMEGGGPTAESEPAEPTGDDGDSIRYVDS